MALNNFGFQRQEDYGVVENPVLVPASLRVYRRFLLTSDREFHPMNNSALRYELNKEGWITASCNKTSHKSPQVNCTCGFYAHYSPYENFYPRLTWDTTPIIFAAVEVSGTTVCGNLGVRAEKMKILAVSVVWDKHRRSPLNAFDGDGGFRPPMGYVEGVLEAAKKVRAKVFPNEKALISAYPQPDLSSLPIPLNDPPVLILAGNSLRAEKTAEKLRISKWLWVSRPEDVFGVDKYTYVIDVSFRHVPDWEEILMTVMTDKAIGKAKEWGW